MVHTWSIVLVGALGMFQGLTGQCVIIVLLHVHVHVHVYRDLFN